MPLVITAPVSSALAVGDIVERVNGRNCKGAIATAKAGEAIEYARQVLKVMGVPPREPTLVATDNLANKLVGSGEGNAARSKHLLRRYVAFQQRIGAGHVRLVKVSDKLNPSDFLTKMIGAAKLEKSLDYCTNRANAVDAA